MTDEALSFDCEKTFNPYVAFDGHQGCPHCDADLDRLFQQRSGEETPNPDGVKIDYPFDGPGGVV